jgi:hypothetical protein
LKKKAKEEGGGEDDEICHSGRGEKRPLTAMKQRKKDTAATSNQEEEPTNDGEETEEAEYVSVSERNQRKEEIHRKWKIFIEGVLSPSFGSFPSRSSAVSSKKESSVSQQKIAEKKSRKNKNATNDDDSGEEEEGVEPTLVPKPPIGKKPVNATAVVAASKKSKAVTIKATKEDEEDLVGFPSLSGDQDANNFSSDEDSEVDDNDNESEIMIIPGKKTKEKLKKAKAVKRSAKNKTKKAAATAPSSVYDAFLNEEDQAKGKEGEDLITKTRKQFHSQLKQLQNVIDNHSKTISSLKHKSLSMENDYLKQQKDFLKMISNSSLDQQTLQSMILDRQVCLSFFFFLSLSVLSRLSQSLLKR